MYIDDTDLKIIRRLWDGRTPFSEISKEIGIITNTVRKRVNRLIENGILQIIGLADPDAIPDTYSAFIGFKIQPPKIKKALKQIGALIRSRHSRLCKRSLRCNGPRSFQR